MKPDVQISRFGSLPDGSPVELFTLTSGNGITAKVTNFGATLTELHVPDRAGHVADVVLGFAQLDGYLKSHPYFGSTVGRVANRIAKGTFTLEGKRYSLAINNGPNHLHGGLRALDKVVWKAERLPGAAVKFSYLSPDGEENYPGNLKLEVLMSLTDTGGFRIDYRATTDQPTPVNLTNHAYFNLAGGGDILGHELMIAADQFTPVDADLIPTGEIKSVKGTPLDFTTPAAMGRRMKDLGTEPPGYDNNYVLHSRGEFLALAARVYEPKTGRVMEVHTTEPGIQFYTGNFLDGTLVGKGGKSYGRHTGFCLETQHFPDAVNQPAFPSVILNPGQEYQQTTIYKFSTK